MKQLMCIDVRTSERLQEFLNNTKGLHDAVIRGAALVAPATIDARGWLHNLNDPATARVIFHSQLSEVGIVDAFFYGVSTFAITAGTDLDADGEIVNDDLTLRLSAWGDDRIVCSWFSYRIRCPIDEFRELPWALSVTPAGGPTSG